MKKLKRAFGRFLYFFVKGLPVSYSRVKLGQKGLRGFCARLILDKCGKNVNIERNASFAPSVTLGANVTIGKNVMMGPNVKIYTQNHETSRTDIPMCEQGVKEISPVVIGDDVWICESVIILPGSRIGNGVILGAGAVVRGNIPDNAVVIGNPARIIKYRGEQK